MYCDYWVQNRRRLNLLYAYNMYVSTANGPLNTTGF